MTYADVTMHYERGTVTLACPVGTTDAAKTSPLVRLLRRRGQPGTVVDVGAGVGLFTAASVLTLGAARALALEADPAHLDVLRINARRCGEAGGCEPAVVDLRGRPKALDDVLDEAAPGESVDLMRFDRRHASVDSLRGADAILSTDRPTLVFEMTAGASDRHVLSWLRSRGFRPQARFGGTYVFEAGE